MVSIRLGLLVVTDLPIILVGNLPTLMPIRPALFDSDKLLFDGLYRREERAYEWLYINEFPKFRYWVSRNNGTDEDAEDAFQRGMVGFLLNLESGRYQYQPTTKVTTVIFDYAKRAWLSELESARIRHDAPMPVNLNMADPDDVLHEMIRKETVDVVRAALAQLKEGCRQIIQFFYMNDLSLREIADKLNLKESSVKSKRYDCTEQLKQFYIELAKQRGQ